MGSSGARSLIKLFIAITIALIIWEIGARIAPRMIRRWASNGQTSSKPVVLVARFTSTSYLQRIFPGIAGTVKLGEEYKLTEQALSAIRAQTSKDCRDLDADGLAEHLEPGKTAELRHLKADYPQAMGIISGSVYAPESSSSEPADTEVRLRFDFLDPSSPGHVEIHPYKRVLRRSAPNEFEVTYMAPIKDWKNLSVPDVLAEDAALVTALASATRRLQRGNCDDGCIHYANDWLNAPDRKNAKGSKLRNADSKTELTNRILLLRSWHAMQCDEKVEENLQDIDDKIKKAKLAGADLYNRGVYLLWRGKPGDAMKDFDKAERAIAWKKDDPHIITAQAIAYVMQGNPDQARTHFKQALELASAADTGGVPAVKLTKTQAIENLAMFEFTEGNEAATSLLINRLDPSSNAYKMFRQAQNPLTRCSSGSAKNCEELCEDNVKAACVKRAELAGNLDSDDQDDEADKIAVKYYKKACALYDAGACADVGYRFSQNRPKPMNKNENPLIFYEKSCELHSALGCANKGVRLLNRGDKAGAEEPLSWACAQNNQFGCVIFAENFLNKSEEFPQKRQRYTTACESGEPAGCLELGRLLRRTDPDAAREIFAKGCKAGLKSDNYRQNCCLEMADLDLAKATSSRPDDSTLKTIETQLQVLCRTWRALGCRKLGDLYVNHYEGLAMNKGDALAAAKEKYDRACNIASDDYACSQINKIDREITGIPDKPSLVPENQEPASNPSNTAPSGP